MAVQHRQQSAQKRNIESLAQESKLSIVEVTQLYEDEQARLEIGARLTSYLPILALRHVREMLRRRCVDAASTS